MKDFMSILLSFIFLSIVSSIDSAFNNLISNDAIIVAGSFLLIDTLVKSFGEIGIRTYRITRKDEWKYLWFNILFSFIMGCLVLIFKNTIVNIFDITITQKNMLSSLLEFYILYLILKKSANSIFEIIRLKGELILYRKSLILHSISLIMLDVLVYIFTRSLSLLFVATMIAWIIAIIYMLYNLNLKFEYPDRKSLDNLIKYGLPYSLKAFLSRILLLYYGVLASHMSTENYTIHTICYSICSNLEVITEAYQATLMIEVFKAKTYEEQYKVCMDLGKKYFKVIISLNFIFAFIYLLISHGSLPLYKCLPYIIFYAITVFGQYSSNTYETLCIIQGKSIALFVSSIVGKLMRFFICLLFINTQLALFAFGIANFLDFYFRGLVYRALLFKLEKNKLN